MNGSCLMGDQEFLQVDWASVLLKPVPVEKVGSSEQIGNPSGNLSR